MLEGFRYKFLFGLLGFECVKTCSDFFSVTGGHVTQLIFPPIFGGYFEKWNTCWSGHFVWNTLLFSPFFHMVPGGHHGKTRRKSNHGVTLVLCFLKRPPFFSFFFPWCSVATIGKREENLTMVLNSLHPLAIGFTSPCTQAPILLNALQLHLAFH